MNAKSVKSAANDALPMDRERAVKISRNLETAILPTVEAAAKFLEEAWVHPKDGTAMGAYYRLKADIHRRSRMAD